MSDSQIQHTLPGMPESLTPGPDARVFLPTLDWMKEGLRASFFLSPRVAGKSPAPWQIAVVSLLVFAIELAALRTEVSGAARFDLQAWLSGFWTLLVFIGLAWWVFPAARAPDEAFAQEKPAPLLAGVGACFVLWVTASLPNTLVYAAWTAATMQGWVTAKVFSSPWFYWSFYLVLTAWSVGVSAFLIVRYAGRTWRAALFVLALAATTGVTVWQFEARTWERDYSAEAATEAPKPKLRLSQQVFEEQQSLMQSAMAAIAPERPGVTDVYALVFAPYAPEDVFIRESSMVSSVLAGRFDAEGRVVHLLNHGTTSKTHLWATPLNLQRAVDALAQRMDRDNDVLVVYLTSHGARDFKLAASHWPLEVDPLSPIELRRALDQAGIRNRVIAVSACYSGGWIDVLAGDNSLVMTAADATHTSYGCGRLSELTFFGRALFDEQLRKIHSFEKAFAAAVPLIKQREIDAGKDDGFSNPQIKVGANIGPVLQALEQRLAALRPATPEPPAKPVSP